MRAADDNGSARSTVRWRELPIPVWIVSVILAAQFLALVALAVWMLVEFWIEPPELVSSAVFLVLLTVAAAALWGVGMRALWRGSAKARGVVVFTQLMVAAVAVSLLQAQDPAWPVVILLGIPAIGAGMLALFSRAFASHLGVDDSRRR
ncbi:MAG TPA: hypothetical protein GX406_02875 [Pseudoclavibacter sp.]|nr:hypothetical protein [Pseudoclavibacter sp.]